MAPGSGSPASDEVPAGPRVVLFLHIPKTAGTTLAEIIRRQYAVDEYLLLEPRTAQARLAELDPESRARLRFVRGHFRFGIHEHLGRPWMYITMLRDPVDRVLSLYAYARTETQHPLYRRLTEEDVSLERFVEEAMAPEIVNGQTRRVAGTRGPVDGAALEVARRNLREHVALTGLTERFDETLLLLQRRLGWRTPYYAPLNVTVRRLDRRAVPPRVARRIEERTALDHELYEEARRRFEGEIAAQGAGFANRVAAFRAANRVVGPGWAVARKAGRAVRRLRPRRVWADEGGPLVSVITPCRNPGARLRQCLDSVIRQTYPHVEHLVVDGGSTDGTLDLLRERPDVRWTSGPDTGPPQAINRGFAMADGRILTWLNADDALLPDAVERAVAAFRADPAVGWVYGDVRIVGAGSPRTRRAPPRLGADAFRAGNPVPQPGTFFTAEALAGAGGRLDESFSLAYDFELWLRFQRAGVRAAYVPATMAVFEIHAGSKTGESDPAAFWAEMARALLQHGRTEDARATLDRWWWRREYAAVAGALRAGRLDDARREAARVGTLVTPRRLRQLRLFLMATRVSPRLSRRLLGLVRPPVGVVPPAPADADPSPDGEPAER